MTQAELPTTDGALALGNLDAEIAGLERDVAKDPSLDRAGALVEGLASRGQFLGRLADYERAAALADAAVARSGNDARAYAMRAKARAIFHRFGDARADLDRVEALGAPAPLAQRAAILQAEGRYDEALTIRHRLSEQKADLSSLASEASVLADMGESVAVRSGVALVSAGPHVGENRKTDAGPRAPRGRMLARPWVRTRGLAPRLAVAG